MTEPSGQIDHVLTENRSFPPPAEFTEKAVFSSMEQYEEVYRQAAEDRDGFWRDEANEHLTGSSHSTRFANGKLHTLSGSLVEKPTQATTAWIDMLKRVEAIRWQYSGKENRVRRVL